MEAKGSVEALVEFDFAFDICGVKPSPFAGVTDEVDMSASNPHDMSGEDCEPLPLMTLGC